MKVVSIVGESDAGKTTLVERLVAALDRAGATVGTVKGIHHAVELDDPGTDTHRHRSAGAARVVGVTPDLTASFRPVGKADGGPDAALDRALAEFGEDVDVVLVEGFSGSALPKIVVGDPGASDYAGPELARVPVPDDADVDALATRVLAAGADRGTLPADGTMVDLTRAIAADMPVYPGDPEVSITPAATHDADGYRVSGLALGTHAGTHVDAPRHVDPDGATLGAYDLADFRLDARRVAVDADARAEIGPERFPEPDDADVLVVDTGWAERWGTPAYADHPYLSADAAAWCVEHDYHLALDTFGPDPTPTGNADPSEPTGVPAHERLLGAGKLVFENLAGLDVLPPRFTLRAYPLKVDADGAPVRAVAELTD
ncbi:molybdopterin-guanine dinucleotide biosynthesis protein MobB [Halarchaeum solikamskense]|uniref:molybdopterin-guanine dinucleotide biosynthesis protein B n=1 Tax=Halarchaeum nitratireducens TaxID=489913 RepID=UPI001B3AADC1|nr:molybdopterin-guanine dinucleotide biosynthesis protein B [Halarchaeum solikamskense]MBP2249964.1 molybdopterin-guanine dinucleotide biosynthesis protein MobB [Halarchaeum solikamskense]